MSKITYLDNSVSREAFEAFEEFREKGDAVVKRLRYQMSHYFNWNCEEIDEWEKLVREFFDEDEEGNPRV